MPDQTNIVVKKYDNTTDVTYVAVAGASADGVAAEYQNQTGFSIPATRPTVRITSRNNGKGTARRVNVSMKWPLSYTDPNGKLVISGSVPGEFSMVLPQDVEPDLVREATQQFVKLLASDVLREVLDTGMAPR